MGTSRAKIYTANHTAFLVRSELAYESRFKAMKGEELLNVMTTGDTRHPWETLGPTWIEVDLGVLAANFRAIAEFVRRPPPPEAEAFLARYGLRPASRPRRIMVVVKADGYGHGAAETARTAVEAGADMLGVSTLLEALELRRAAVAAPILMFNPLTPAEAETAVRFAVTPTVTDLKAASALSAAVGEHGWAGGGAAPVHVSVDTGMSRYGLAPDDAAAFVSRLATLPGLTLEGLYTHFSAGADYGAASLAVMRRQLRRFARAVAAVEALGLEVPLRHAACSSAIVRLPESYFDLVRVGNLFYGFGPTGAAERESPRVAQAWSMVTRVLEVREVPAGTGVGYGPDVTVRRPTRLATVPVGYADGVGAEVQASTFKLRVRLRLLFVNLFAALGRRRLLPGPLAALGRRALGHAVFSYRGRPLDIVGRISMQHTILDVTSVPEADVGAVVRVRVRRVLASPRLPRIYLLNGRAVAVRALPGLVEEIVPRAGVGDADSFVPRAGVGDADSLPLRRGAAGPDSTRVASGH